MKFIVHTDGGARGNPGPAAVGVVIEISNIKYQISNSENKKVIEISKRIGESTNNVAEYSAVFEGLRTIQQYNSTTMNKNEKLEIQFFLDSNLVVQQLNGTFKVKDARLRELLMQIRTLEQEVGGGVTYTYVPREENRRADWLVNKALDHPHVSFS